MKKAKKTNKKNIDSTGITVLYYFVQYIILRFALVGARSTPTIEQIYNGFNIRALVLAVLSFFNYIKYCFSAGNIFVLVFVFVPYCVRILWEMRNIIIYAYGLLCLITSLTCFLGYQSYKSKIDISKCVIIKVGAPGAGKSSSGLWQAVEIAKRLWTELQDKYFMLKHDIDKRNKKGEEISEKLLKDWKETRAAYEFYKQNDCAPCLWSNIPFTVDGKHVNALRREHIRQLRRLAAFSVLFLDEIGAVVSVDEGRDKPLEISDFFRLCRHFGEFRIICTEQDRENIYIDIRRVVADNEQMLSQKWVLKPLVPVLLFQFTRFIWRLNRVKLKFLIPLLKLANRSLRYIGFRRFKAVSTGNAESAYNEKQKKRTYYLPTMLNCTYDDRTYREGYKAKTKKIKADIFQSLVLPEKLCAMRDS